MCLRPPPSIPLLWGAPGLALRGRPRVLAVSSSALLQSGSLKSPHLSEFWWGQGEPGGVLLRQTTGLCSGLRVRIVLTAQATLASQEPPWASGHFLVQRGAGGRDLVSPSHLLPSDTAWGAGPQSCPPSDLGVWGESLGFCVHAGSSAPGLQFCHVRCVPVLALWWLVVLGVGRGSHFCCLARFVRKRERDPLSTSFRELFVPPKSPTRASCLCQPCAPRPSPSPPCTLVPRPPCLARPSRCLSRPCPGPPPPESPPWLLWPPSPHVGARLRLCPAVTER